MRSNTDDGNLSGAFQAVLFRIAQQVHDAGGCAGVDWKRIRLSADVESAISNLEGTNLEAHVVPENEVLNKGQAIWWQKMLVEWQVDRDDNPNSFYKFLLYDNKEDGVADDESVKDDDYKYTLKEAKITDREVRAFQRASRAVYQRTTERLAFQCTILLSVEGLRTVFQPFLDVLAARIAVQHTH
jgi:hypothetical protein